MNTPPDQPAGIRFEGTPPPPPIPDHELIRRIGRGSYGEVWLARNVMGTYRAVKIVHRQSFQDDRPFEREFAGLQRFEPVSRTHDSQVDILHIGRSNDWFYYVMELADDELTGAEINPEQYRPHTLRTAHEGHVQSSAEETLEIGLALTTALEHLHSYGLIHRDIKPSNVIFVNGLPKLADIGLVSSVDATRSFVGTEGFVPPEGPGAPTADLYSLGKLLYELCTGRDRKDYPELPTSLAESPDRERLLELNAIIAKACRENPKDRYQSAEQMRDDLLLMQSGKSVRRMQRLERRVAQIKNIGLAALAVVAISVAGYLFQRHQTAEARRLAEENIKLAEESQRHAEESEANARESNDHLVRMLVAEGNKMMEDGSPADSLPWFVEALKRVEGNPERERMHRIRLDSILRQIPRIIRLYRHKAGVRWCRFSPDGSRIASASSDGSARVWDVASGEALTGPLRHQNGVSSIMFSHDGRWVVTASWDKTARVWDVATGEAVSPPLSQEYALSHAEFSPDDRFVLTIGAERGGAQLWDAKTWMPAGPKLGGRPWVKTARFSPDGQFVLTGDDRGTVGLWTVPDGKAVFPPMVVGYSVNCVAFSPDGKSFATGSGIPRFEPPDPGVARIWSASTGKPLTSELRHAAAIRHICFSPDSRRLLTDEAGKGIVRIWDVSAGRQIGADLTQGSRVWSSVFSPDGSRILTCSENGRARVWDAESGDPQTPPLEHESWALHATFSPDGHLVATASEDGYVRIWDLSVDHGLTFVPFDEDLGTPTTAQLSPDGKSVLLGFDDAAVLWDLASGTNLIPAIKPPHTGVDLAKFSPDGSRILLADTRYVAGTNVTVWSADTGVKLAEVAHSALIRSAAFSPDGQHVLTVSDDKTARVWDADTGHPASPVLEHPHSVWHGKFSPDGSNVVTSSQDNRARVWEWSTGRQSLPPLRHKGSVTFVAFSPDGRRILTTSQDQTVRVWDARTGAPVTSPLFHGGTVLGVSFRPDGQAFASWSQSRRSYVWDLETGKRLLPELSHEARQNRVEFSHDGRLLVTASSDKTARIWDAATGEPITVPLLHGGSVENAAFSPRESVILTAADDGSVRLWEFGLLDWPLEDIAMLSDLLKTREIDSTLRPGRISRDRIGTAFSLLRERHPSFFSDTSPANRLASHRAQANQMVALRRWSAAIWHLQQLAQAQPEDAGLQRRLGNAQAMCGRWEEARQSFAREAEILSKYSYELIVALIQSGDVESARKIVAEILPLAITDEELQRVVCRAARLLPGMLDDYPSVIEFAEKDFARSPQSTGSARNLAMVYLRAGRLPDAVRLLNESPLRSRLNQLRGREAIDPSVGLVAAVILAHYGDHEQSREYLQLATFAERIGEKDADWHSRCYWAWWRQEAEAILNQAAR